MRLYKCTMSRSTHLHWGLTTTERRKTSALLSTALTPYLTIPALLMQRQFSLVIWFFELLTLLASFRMLYPNNDHYFRQEAVHQVHDLEPRHGAEQLLHLLPGPGHAQAGQEEQTQEHLVSLHILLVTWQFGTERRERIWKTTFILFFNVYISPLDSTGSSKLRL